ncbi:MAG: LamG domain-containing protein, partial [Alphaproteobacteria bacterium]|nr:LamG domain-containing protein [Alphaproteobacteria bacterium]
MRASIYIRPIGDDRHATPGVAPSAALSGNNILFDAGTRFEQSAPGFDVEFGHAIPFIPDTRAYIAHYDFDVDNGRDVTGYRTRVASDLNDYIRVGMEYQFNDSVRDNDISASVRLRLPFGGTSQHNTHTGIRARMMEPVVRDIDIITQAPAPTPQTVMKADGSGPAHIFFVENTAAPGGDGTATRPFNILTAAENAAGTYDTIYVLPGNGGVNGMNNGITLDDAGQRLLGGGVALTLDTRRALIPTALNGYVLQPETSAPVITNGAGHGITVAADHVGIAGLTVDGAAGDGIRVAAGAGGSVQDLTIDRVRATNNTGNGLTLYATAGGHVGAAVSNSQFRDNAAHGVVAYDDTVGTFAVDLGGGTAGSIGNNALYDNALEDLAVELDGGTLAAENNYWGQAGGPTASQIFTGAPSTAALAAHWQLNNGTGDRIGNHNATLNNGAAYDNAGQLGGAILLDRTAMQYIEAADFAAADTGDKLTVSYWINPATLAATATHLAKWDETNTNNNNTWGVRAANADGTELYFFIADAIDSGNNFFATSDANLVTGEWAMLTMVYDGNGATNADRLKVYKNGVQLNGAFVGNIAATLNQTAESVTFGRQLVNVPAFAQYFDGRVDDIRIYSDSLTAAQIAELYRMNGNSTVNSNGA